MASIGVLALQGGFAAHIAALESLGHEAVPVRYASQLPGLDGLVLPGGESTAQWRALERERMLAPLREFPAGGRPVLATCAGLVLAATTVSAPSQPGFAWLDIDVRRNGWGRQRDSFQAKADDSDLPLIFIRAPRITAIGAGTDVLATLNGEAILVRKGCVLGCSFHPELTADRRIHREAFGGN